jgi:hypothetical protein
MTTPMGPTAEQPALSGANTPPQVVYVKERPHWSRRVLMVLGSLALVVLLLFGLMGLNLIPRFSNPFATKTTDRTGPVLLESMKDLSQYVAAEGNFQVLVDLQQNSSYIPDFIFNQRTLFVGVGSVKAYVDFSKLTSGDLVVSPDGKSVTINLPRPTLDQPSLDPNASYVFAQDRGVINRIQDFFGNDPNTTQELYKLASSKIASAASASDLLSRAETNTKSMLESLMKQLGFTQVIINFAPAP